MKKRVPSQSGWLVVSVVTLGILLVLMAGCGGGGTPTSASSPPPSSSSTVQPVGENHSPVIDSIISEYTQIERGKSGKIRCIASDPDGDTLTYSWEVDRGSISGSGALVTYNAPESYVDAQITVAVSDSRGAVVWGTISLPVVCCGYAKKNPDWSE
jgi:hypothetical protein